MTDNEKDINTAAADKEADELRKVLDTPISAEEYRKAAADIEVDQAKLCVIRQKLVTQIGQLQLNINRIDEQLGVGKMQLGVLYRRALNRRDGEAEAEVGE